MPGSVQNAPVLRGYKLLGAITADQAVESVFPAARVRGGAGHDQSMRDGILNAANAGRMINKDGSPLYVPGTGDCAGYQSQAQMVTSDISRGGAAIAPFTGPAAPFVFLGATIVGMFGQVFNHHAKAVQVERGTLCAAVPAANNYLALIDQAVAEGKATPQNAIAALDSLVGDFSSKTSAIRHGNDPMASGECNAACVMLTMLRAIVEQKKSQYQDLAAQQSTRVTSSGPSSAPAISSGSVMVLPGKSAAPSTPRWLPVAAVVVAGFFLMRAF